MTMQRMPRLPRSMLSVRPTGPAPTIRTSVSIAVSRYAATGLIDRRARTFDDLAPANNFRADESLQFRDRVAVRRHKTDTGDGAPRVRQGHDGFEFAMQFVDDGRRRRR